MGRVVPHILRNIWHSICNIGQDANLHNCRDVVQVPECVDVRPQNSQSVCVELSCIDQRQVESMFRQCQAGKR